MDNLISVIVPVYNVEAYLNKCIDSILKNDYQNIEVILVDDGSSDHSGKICDEYEQVDGRVSVIHKENGGLSSARNVGLKLAKGDFITFVDSDDSITSNMFRVMLKSALEHNADIVQCGYDRVDELGKIRSTETDSFQLLTDQKSIFKAFFVSGMIRFPSQMKLYRRKLLENHWFVEGKLHEDVMFISDILNSIKRYVIIPDVCYVYLLRKNSIMRSRFSEKRLDVLYAHQYAMNNYKEYASGYVYYYERHICLSCFNLYYLLYFSKGEKRYYKIINNVWELYKGDVIPRLREVCGSKSSRLELILFSINKKMAVIFYHWYRHSGFSKI